MVRKKPRPGSHVRAALIQISVSPVEKKAIAEAARRQGKPVSEYLRDLHELSLQAERGGRVLYPISPEIVEATIAYASQLQAERAGGGDKVALEVERLRSHLRNVLDEQQISDLTNLPLKEWKARSERLRVLAFGWAEAGKFPKRVGTQPETGKPGFISLVDFWKYVAERATEAERAEVRAILLAENRAVQGAASVETPVTEAAHGKARKTRPRRA
jgi:hypothetical protein